MDNYIVYMHMAPSGKKYIGITRQSTRLRWRDGKGYKNNIYFSRAINKLGWENFEHKILYEMLNKDEAERHEINLIRLYKTTNKKFGFNLEGGGHAKESVSLESRKKMSVSSTGIRHTEETKKKISEGGRGLRRSEETRLHISEAQRGEKNHQYGKIAHNAKPVLQLSKQNEVINIYSSSHEAEKKTGIKHRSIRNVCCGSRKTTGGFGWRYV